VNAVNQLGAFVPKEEENRAPAMSGVMNELDQESRE
jgi:hypothetical protein